MGYFDPVNAISCSKKKPIPGSQTDVGVGKKTLFVAATFGKGITAEQPLNIQTIINL